MNENNLDLYHKKYSEQELEENINLFDLWLWKLISVRQTLSEEFIEKYSNEVDWYYISKYQILSEKFIKNNSSKINFDSLMENNNLSKKVKDKIEKEINLLKEII